MKCMLQPNLEKKFGDSDGVCCIDVNQGNYTFITHHYANEKLEIHIPHTTGVCRLLIILLECMCFDQSGTIYIADWKVNKVHVQVLT